MDQAEPSAAPTSPEPAAGERYLLLADISGYTGFMTGVEHEHGVDFSDGIPAAYGVLAELLNAVIEGVEHDFAIVKLEGDAVFAAAPAANLDGRGDPRPRGSRHDVPVVHRQPHGGDPGQRPRLHRLPRGRAPRPQGGAPSRPHGSPARSASSSDLLGPAVTVAHRLLKNTVRDRIGFRPYVYLTDAAATALGVPEVGLAHPEEYADAGRVDGRIVELGEPGGGGLAA